MTAIAVQLLAERAAPPEPVLDVAGDQPLEPIRALEERRAEDPSAHAAREIVSAGSPPGPQLETITVTAVLAGTDTRMADMSVHVLASDPDLLPIDLTGRRPDAVTGERGTATLVVPSTTTFLCAHRPGFYGRIVLSNAQSPTRPRQPHYTIEVDEDSTLDVIVLHLDGRPAEGVELYLGLVDGAELITVRRRERSGAEGRARFEHTGMLRRGVRHELSTGELRVAAIGLGFRAFSDPLPEPMRGDLVREVVVPDLAPLRVLVVPGHRGTSIPEDCIVEVREHSDSPAWLGYVGESATTAAADGTRIAKFEVVVGRSFDVRCRLRDATTTLTDVRGPIAPTEPREITLRVKRPHIRISWPLPASPDNTVRASLRDALGQSVWSGPAERRFGAWGIDIDEEAAPLGAQVELLVLDARAGEVSWARWTWRGRDERVDLEAGERIVRTELEIVDGEGATLEGCGIGFAGDGESGDALWEITPSGSGRYTIASDAPLAGTLTVRRHGFVPKQFTLPAATPIRIALQPARGAELVLRGFTGSDLSALSVSVRSGESSFEIQHPSMTRFGAGGDVVATFADLPFDRALATIATRNGEEETRWVVFHQTDGVLRAVVDLGR